MYKPVLKEGRIVMRAKYPVTGYGTESSPRRRGIHPRRSAVVADAIRTGVDHAHYLETWSQSL